MPDVVFKRYKRWKDGLPDFSVKKEGLDLNLPDRDEKDF